MTYFPVKLTVGGVLQPPLICADQEYHTGLNECAQSAPHRSSLQKKKKKKVCTVARVRLNNVLHQLFPENAWMKSYFHSSGSMRSRKMSWQVSDKPPDRVMLLAWAWTWTRSLPFSRVFGEKREREKRGDHWSLRTVTSSSRWPVRLL